MKENDKAKKKDERERKVKKGLAAVTQVLSRVWNQLASSQPARGGTEEVGRKGD